jgi:Domain of unknown function (DUF4110)/Kelch motif
MAKKKTRDPEKRAALAAKKEAKQERAARKRIAKETGVSIEGDNQSSDDDEDDIDNVDIDRLLQRYKQQDAAAAAGGGSLCKVVACDGFPLARAHATFTIATDESKKKKDAYLFGGEYHDGAHTVVSDQLFKYELATGKWKQLITCTTPPPRCSHSAAYYNKCLYIFGGEHYTASTSDYRHYKDVWKFDTVQQQWTEIKPPSTLSVGGGTTITPSARSGTAVAVWKHHLILFGGFTEAADQPARWYNDIYVLNLQTEQWIGVPHSRLSARPEPRSACNTALLLDTAQWLIHGGFSKLPNRLQQQQQPSDDATHLPVSETIVHTDAWVLHLTPLLSDKPPTWERWTSSLSRAKRIESAHVSPNGRSGVGSVSYCNNMLLFGGVVDQELHHHKVDSMFYNDLSIFHVEKRKFIPIRLANAESGKSKKVQGAISNDDGDDDDDEGVANDLVENNDEHTANVEGWDLQKLRSNMFAFVDGDGNLIYEKIHAVKRRLDKDSAEEKRSSVSELAPDVIVERTEPLPRIKSCMFLNGHTLYVCGGLVEVGDREVTLDDMWCIDLRKNRKWQCIFPGTMHQQVWRGAVHDDDDSYYSSNAGVSGDGHDLTDREDDGAEESNCKEAEETKSPEKLSGRSVKDEIIFLVEKHSLGDEEQSPLPDESLEDFYDRTAEFWNEKFARTRSDKTSANLKAQSGFDLACDRYKSLEPVIKRVMELKLLRKKEKVKTKAK